VAGGERHGEGGPVGALVQPAAEVVGGVVVGAEQQLLAVLASDGAGDEVPEPEKPLVEDFRTYARAAGGDVKVTEAGGGTVELRVTSGRRKLSAVQDRAWAQKAKREFDPTAEQLRRAGVAVRDARLTLSGLEEVLVLDAKTYRIRSHRFGFGFLLPYGGADIAFAQQASEENQGVYAGRIEPPAGAR
jgi:hypothetical protein